MDRRELLTLGAAGVPLLLGGGRGRPRTPVLGGGASRSPLALVTADLEAHVVAVDTRTHRVVGRVPTAPGPRSIEGAPGGRAVVAHADEGVVSLLAGRPPRVVAVLRGFGQPRYTAISPGGRYAYVSDSGHGELATIDLVERRVLARTRVGALARHVGLAPDGRTLLVALGSSAPSVAVVDVSAPRRPRVRRHLRAPFLIHDVGFSPSGRRAWLTAGREPRIAVVAADGRDPVVLGADAGPQHLSFGRGVVYVTSGDDGTVRVHALSDGRVRARARIPRGSYNVQRDGGLVLSPSLGTGALTAIGADGAVRWSTRVARAAHDACVVR